jgi:hypothetical protein
MRLAQLEGHVKHCQNEYSEACRHADETKVKLDQALHTLQTYTEEHS